MGGCGAAVWRGLCQRCRNPHLTPQAQPPADGVRLFLGELCYPVGVGWQGSSPSGGHSPSGTASSGTAAASGGEGQQPVSAPLPRSGLAAHKAAGTKGGGKGGGTKPKQAGSVLLRNFGVDETSSQPYQEQIRDALSKNAVRVIDLFREWDEDEDGTVSKKEFRKAMPMLGLHVPAQEVDTLFDSWDPDGSGMLELKELTRVLKGMPAVS